MPVRGIDTGNEEYFVTGDPHRVTVPMLYKENIEEQPKDVPDGAIFKKSPNGHWGLWVFEGKDVYGVKRPETPADQIDKAVSKGKGALLNVIAPVVDTITSDIPIGVMNGFYHMVEKTGMQVPDELKNMGREGARAMTTAALTTAIFRNPAVGGASQAHALRYALNQALAGFGIGAGASGASQAMFGKEFGMQTEEEHRTDFMTTLGASVGGRTAQHMAKMVRNPKFAAALKRGQNAMLMDKVLPPQYRAWSRLANHLGEVPTPWWSVAGNIAGSGVGFTAASDAGLTSAQGLMSVAVPGVFNVYVAGKGARLEQRIGIGGRPEGPSGSLPEAAHELTEKLADIPVEQRMKRFREYRLWRGVMNNSSPHKGLDTDRVSLAVLVNDINAQRDINRRLDPAAAASYASEVGKQRAAQLFPNQWGGQDLFDFAHSLEFVKGRTTRRIMQPLPGANRFKEVVEDITNPFVADLKKALPKTDPNAISMGLYGGRPATDEALNFLTAVEKMVTETAADVSGDKLKDFGALVNSLRKAADDNPKSAPMLQRVVDKLKDTFVNEGVFGEAYGSGKATALPEDITDLEFDGQRILDYLLTKKRSISAFMGDDEIKSLTQVARLMKAGQDTGLSSGSFQRNIERVTNFSKYRMTFYFASGAFLGGGGENPMARILFGATSVIAGGRAVLMGGNALYKLGAKNPAVLKKLVNAHIKGDRITEGLAWRTLVREDPEMAKSLGIGEEEVQEQSGVTSGFFDQFLPVKNPFQ